jgi:hypothetical protein
MAAMTDSLRPLARHLSIRSGQVAKFTAAVSLVALASAVGWGAIPDRAGAIHACYNTGTGVLRVVDPGPTLPVVQQCKSGEKALAWAQSGKNSASSAISVTRADSGPISSPGAPFVPIITAINVPAGAYVVVAKTRVDDTETDGGDCQLMYSASGTADTEADTASQSPYKGAHPGVLATYNL